VAKEIIIYAKSIGRAQYVANLILAAHCLYSGDLITSDTIPIFPNRAKTTDEIAEQLIAGGRGHLGVMHLPVSCLIASKASQKLAYQYAIFKYLLSSRTIPLSGLALDPAGDWVPGKTVSELPEEHVLNAYAIILCYSVIEELSFEIRATTSVPSKIDGQWNPTVKQDLENRLDNAGINLSDRILWHLRDTPTNIERRRRPKSLQRTEWAHFKVRDSYLDVIDAIDYSSWLRSKVSAHRLSRLSKSLTIYDVANVQHLARRLLLETLGFWRFYQR
ncbi:hypothetical protein KA005_40225, partial [bacterium]|nr:hypothetical protein [bacterium]